MEPTKNPEPPAGLARFTALMPLYTRLGWGLVIVFGIVGFLSGRTEQAFFICAMTAIMWTCMRILAEAIQSIAILGKFKQWEEEQKKPPTPPPTDDDTAT